MKPSVEDVPPHNLEAETALLGSIFLDAPQLPAVARILRPDDFYARNHRLVYDAMIGLHLGSKPVDPVLIAAEMERRRTYEDVGGRDFILSLVASVDSGANALHYARLVVDSAQKREYYRASSELLAASKNGHTGADLALKAKNALDAIASAFADTDTQDPFGTVAMTETDQTPWILRGYLARRAVTLMTALPKCGKTTLAYSIAAALQRNDSSFCDLAIPERDVDVLVLSEEDDSVLAETWRAVGLDASRTPAITRRKAFPRRPLATDIDAAIKKIEANPKIALVILDTWRFWANLPDKGSNDADMTNRAFQEIARLAATGVAVLLLHHSRKADGEQGTAASGSNALTGSADILLELRRFGKGEDATMRALTAYGRFQRIPAELVIDYRGGTYTSCGDASDAREAASDHRVAAFLLSRAEWLPADVIEEQITMKKAATLAALKRLSAKGLIQRTGKGAKNSPFLYASLNVPLHAQPTRESTPF